MVNKQTLPHRPGSRIRAEAGPPRRRTRGRPRSGQAEDVKQALLSAARELFLRYGYRAVSSRQIAAAAGVNVAMIRYYFGGKPGLYREMIEGMLAPVRAGIEALRARPEAADLGEVMSRMARLWAANPWLAGLLVREVLAPDGPLRTVFLRDLAARFVPIMEQLVRKEIAGGSLRSDLDPRLTLLTMMSLVVFPFVAAPITGPLFGVRPSNEEFLQRFTAHIARVFAQGCLAHHPAESRT